MYCPRCGQKQVSDDVRFCSACGFQLNVVSELLAAGGNLPWRETAARGPRKFSPRQKGIRQGAMLMLSTLLVVPLAAILGVFVFNSPEILVPIAAITCFIGGLLRIMYALLLEDSNPAPAAQDYAPTFAPPGAPAYMNPPPRASALPPQQGTPVPGYRPPRRVDTGELMQRPPSVTENTTRLLKDPPDDVPQQ